MQSDREIILQSRLFEGVGQAVVDKYILPLGVKIALEQNQSLFMPMDKVSSVYLVLSGKIKLEYYMENGEQDIKNLLTPGNLVGVDLICTRSRLSPYQATAAQHSELFVLPADVLLKSGSMPEEARLCCINNLLLIISHVNMQNEYRLAILTRSSLRERIIVYLTMQSNRTRSRSFTIPFSREEMASFLRVNRSALSHELSLLRRERVIDFHRNSFTLLKKSGFELDLTEY